MEQRSDLRPNLFTYSVLLIDVLKLPCSMMHPPPGPTCCSHETISAQRSNRYATLNECIHILQALISALGGQWEKALEVFAEMKEKAKHDPECEPNTITYSVRTGLRMIAIMVQLTSCL